MELLKLLSALWRRKWTVIVSVVLFLAAGIAASALLPEQYSAETEVIIESDDATQSLLSELGLAEMAVSLGTASDDLENKIYLATSPPIVEEVIWKLQLRNGAGELYEVDDVADPGLLAPVFGTPNFVIEQNQGTDVLVITSTAATPEAAQLLADTVAEVYIDEQTSTARANMQQAELFIQQQLGEVTRQLDTAYGQIADEQRTTEIIDLESEMKAAITRLSDLQADRSATLAKIEETRARIRSAREYRGRESVDDVSPGTTASNPIVQKLRTTLGDATARREALLAQNYTAKAPEVRELDAVIAATREQLQDALNEQATLDPNVATLEAELAGLYERERALAEAVTLTMSQYVGYPDKMRKFEQLRLVADATEQVFRSLQDQRFQIGVAEAMTMADARITARAKLPEDPSSPKVALNLIAGLMLGLMFGIGTALALEYIDDTIQLPDDMKPVWEIPSLGLIPRYKTTTIPALARIDPTDPLAEAYRALRNSISFASLDKPLKILGVTSSVPGEGKSTLAVNLAISMANEGQRVLLVDADLRVPTQHKKFPELVLSPGLSEVVSRSAVAPDAIQRTSIENLSVLTAGVVPPNPGHLIESLRLRQTVLELARSFDVVIVDTPPALAVNDPIVLSRFVDGMIVVVEAHKSSRRMLTETKERFASARTTPLGFVLNKVKPSGIAYGKYTKYYQRRSKETQTAPAEAKRGGGAA